MQPTPPHPNSPSSPKLKRNLLPLNLPPPSHPPFSRNDKEKGIQDILGDGKVSSVTYNLLTTLAGNARLPLMAKIIDTYAELMKANRGEVDATIISADPLTKA